MSKTRPNLVGDQRLRMGHRDQKLANLKTKISYATDISVEEFCGRQLCENERGTLRKEDHQSINLVYSKYFHPNDRVKR